MTNPERGRPKPNHSSLYLLRRESIHHRMVSAKHYKEGIRLAEEADWDTLLLHVKQDRAVAQQKDHYGMLPLHWACTENDVPAQVLSSLISAFPEGPLTKNNAQMLPLHIAIRAKVSALSLKVLCQAYPGALVSDTSDGRNPLDLAVAVELSPDALEVIERASSDYRSHHFPDHHRTSLRIDFSSSSQVDETLAFEHAKRASLLQVASTFQTTDQRESSSSSRASTVSLTSDQQCGKCQRNFSIFKKKYHCHACGSNVCKDHMGGKIELPNYFTRQVVCLDCHQRYNDSSSSQDPIEPEQRHTDGSVRRSGLTQTQKSSSMIDLRIQENNTTSGSWKDRCNDLEHENENLRSRLAEQEAQTLELTLLLTQTIARIGKVEVELNLAEEDEIPDDDEETNRVSLANPFDEDFSDLAPLRRTEHRRSDRNLVQRTEQNKTLDPLRKSN